MPFTLADRFGRLLTITRHKDGYEAGFMQGDPITHYELNGARSSTLNDALRSTVESVGWFEGGSIHTTCSTPCDGCWLWIPDEQICLSTCALHS